MALYRLGYDLVAGVDEVGRGSWAGPVVAAAVILPPGDPALASDLREVRDSKCLASAERVRLAEEIRVRSLAIALGWASHHVIDSQGLAAANRRAMVRAVAHLPTRPRVLLVDAVTLPQQVTPSVSIVKGDSTSLSIACASIVAKVMRDRWMERLGGRFPEYGFVEHKGYGTPQHRRALAEHGLSAYHRRSFRLTALPLT